MVDSSISHMVIVYGYVIVQSLGPWQLYVKLVLTQTGLDRKKMIMNVGAYVAGNHPDSDWSRRKVNIKCSCL